MQITRYTHSCVRLDLNGRSLVIDPGVWSEPAALHAADAVLATHHHDDHFDRMRLAELGLATFGPHTLELLSSAHTSVEAGDTFQAAGFEVRAVGGEHGQVVDSQEPCVNLGYIIDGLIYHPGDSFHVPEQPIDTLFVPLQASWLKTGEAIDFVREVGPRRAYGIHEAQLSASGIAVVNRWLQQECSSVYEWLPAGASVTFDLV